MHLRRGISVERYGGDILRIGFCFSNTVHFTFKVMPLASYSVFFHRSSIELHRESQDSASNQPPVLLIPK